jgi:protein-L-isoaspartate O-methyltransferase
VLIPAQSALDRQRIVLRQLQTWVLGFALGVSAGSVAADSPYQSGPASPDGIGKIYDGREIAHVMGFEGASWLDRPSREREERPEILLHELRLKKGQVVADIGAGSGYLARRMAPRVAPGQVFAVDVQPQMVDLLRGLSQQPGMANIVPVQSTADDATLAPVSLDMAIMVDVYHELEFPYEVMQSLVTALKPGGRIVFVEYRGEDPQVPILRLHKMTEAQVRREMQAFPLVWERTSERLPVQHIIIFRKN